MITYSEDDGQYVKTEGAPLQLGDLVTLHTGEHALTRAPQQYTMEGFQVRVWVVEVNPRCFIPITEMFLDEPVADSGTFTVQ